MKKLLVILMLASLACEGQVILTDGTVMTTRFLGYHSMPMRSDTNWSTGGNAKSIQADSLTSIYSHQSFGEHNICIGRLAGATLTHQGYVVIIGDKSKSDTTKYKDYDIDIDWNWGYFKTCEGKELKGYLIAWQQGSFNGGEGALNIARQNHVEQLRKYLTDNWLQKVSAYYKRRQHKKVEYKKDIEHEACGTVEQGMVNGYPNTQVGYPMDLIVDSSRTGVRFNNITLGSKQPLQSSNNCKTTHLGLDGDTINTLYRQTVKDTIIINGDTSIWDSEMTRAEWKENYEARKRIMPENRIAILAAKYMAGLDKSGEYKIALKERDEQEAKQRWNKLSLEEKLLLYAQECYNDSTKKVLYFTSDGWKDIPNSYFGSDFGSEIVTKIVWTHRKPTFEGFIEWLRKQKLKK